jgi:hypothetical protein
LWFVKPREPKPPSTSTISTSFSGFVGSDPYDASDLGATVNFKIEDECSSLRRARSFIYRRLRHSPFVIEDMKRPILHFPAARASCTSGDYPQCGLK